VLPIPLRTSSTFDRGIPRGVSRDRETSVYDRGVSVPEEHREFARRAHDSLVVDPRPTFERLSEATGVQVDVLEHFALVRWASAGAEALLSVEPRVLQELIDAREREDWRAVAGIIDWLRAGR
jgi:hypothetical protein